MNMGISLIIVLFGAIHILLIIGLGFDLRKRMICVCGHRFHLPDGMEYICSSCGKMHLAVKK